MKKKFTAFLLLLLLVTSVSGQRFTLSPSNTIDMAYGENDYASNTIDIVNNTSESLTFRWRLIHNTFDPGWSFSLCDLGSCFPSPPDSSTMSPTTAGGNALLICHAGFQGISGIGELKLFVFEVGDEANGDTVTWRYTAGTVGVAEELALSNSINVFPNPASESLSLDLTQLKGEMHAAILDPSGRTVFDRVFRAGHVYPIPVEQFGTGIYFLRLRDKDGTTIAKRISII